MAEKDQQSRIVEKTVRDICRATHRQYSVEAKIRIVQFNHPFMKSIKGIFRRF